MTVHDAYNYGDVIFAQEFHGIHQNYTWSFLQTQQMNLTQMVGLTQSLNIPSRKLFASKVFNIPVKEINEVSNKQGQGIPQYRIYSAHDF